MITSALSTQYKSVNENYNLDYVTPKSSKGINSLLFEVNDVAYSYENALESYNSNSSSLNLSKSSLTGNIGLFNSAQLSYDNAVSAEERANKKLELLFDAQTSSTAALMSNTDTLGKEFEAATSAAAVMGDATITPDTSSNNVTQELSSDQIKEITDLQKTVDLQAEYAKLESQHQMEIVQQEAERAKATTEEQSKKLNNIQTLLNNDQETVKSKESLVQTSEEDLNFRKSILIEKQSEEKVSGGSILDLEI